VKRIAITGGIGSGKTLVTDFLQELGFAVVDADIVARSVVAVGQPAWHALRDAFGDGILLPDGHLDRDFMAKVAFSDGANLRRLNAITHAAIGVEIREQLAAATGLAVFVALPLFRSEHRTLFSLDEAWAVLASPAVAEQRLVAYRGFSSEDARARIAAQMTNEDRVALADRIFWNESSPEELLGLVRIALREEGFLA